MEPIRLRKAGGGRKADHPPLTKRDIERLRGWLRTGEANSLLGLAKLIGYTEGGGDRNGGETMKRYLAAAGYRFVPHAPTIEPIGAVKASEAPQKAEGGAVWLLTAKSWEGQCLITRPIAVYEEEEAADAERDRLERVGGESYHVESVERRG